MAAEFNARLDAIPGIPKSIPRIRFLKCAVYTVYDYKLGDVGVLVEEQLDPVQYKKWNDNKGGIKGKAPPGLAAAAPAVDLATSSRAMAAIAESDEDEEEGDEDDEGSSPITIKREDVPQAFSHFSYRLSKRKQLICDLQGVLDESAVPPMFKFTDPVIHHTSDSGRKNVYGRTDRGKDGTDDFFKTHVCSELCRMMPRTWIR